MGFLFVIEVNGTVPEFGKLVIEIQELIIKDKSSPYICLE